MSRQIQIDDYVSVELENVSQTYIIRNITPEGILISPVGDISHQSLIVNTPGGWKIRGADQYRLDFLPHDEVWVFLYIHTDSPSHSNTGDVYRTKKAAAEAVVDELQDRFEENEEGQLVFKYEGNTYTKDELLALIIADGEIEDLDIYRIEKSTLK